MSLDPNKMKPKTEYISAVEQYRAAFERLKRDVPERLPKGTRVSQNNVAKEAGCDTSALKKSRFPLLIAEIQQYVVSQEKNGSISKRQNDLLSRKKNRGLKDRIIEISKQRDLLASLLVEADATILELYARIDQLEHKLPISNVVVIDSTTHKKML